MLKAVNLQRNLENVNRDDWFWRLKKYIACDAKLLYITKLLLSILGWGYFLLNL